MITKRAAEVAFAGFVSLAGLSTAALILLRNPASRLSRWLERNLLPDGISR